MKRTDLMAFTEEYAKFRNIDDIIRDALLQALTEVYDECTDAQQAQFARIFPNDPPETASEATLRSMIGLCRRTVAKNRAERVEKEVS